MSRFSICLTILDIWQGFQYAAGIKYARVLKNLPSSYNNIINGAINVIMLEFLYAWFVDPGAPQPFYIFQHELEQKNDETFNNFSSWLQKKKKKKKDLSAKTF